MDTREVALFACELKEKIEQFGLHALEQFNYSEQLFDLGFAMDRGISFEARYRIKIDDVHGLRHEIDHIDDIQALGNAIFAQCYFMTQDPVGSCERELEWLVIALERLEKLADASTDNAPIAVSYRFADVAEQTIRKFCVRALSDEPVPWRIEYSVQDHMVCDAYVDEIDCLIGLRDGYARLGFEVGTSAWCYREQNITERIPNVSFLHAERKAHDEDTGESVEFVWDERKGKWRKRKKGDSVVEW